MFTIKYYYNCQICLHAVIKDIWSWQLLCKHYPPIVEIHDLEIHDVEIQTVVHNQSRSYSHCELWFIVSALVMVGALAIVSYYSKCFGHDECSGHDDCFGHAECSGHDECFGNSKLL
jgi:hypothetical protein